MAWQDGRVAVVLRVGYGYLALEWVAEVAMAGRCKGGWERV